MKTPFDFERLSREADEVGFRLEIVRGLAIWEAQPVYGHQRAIQRIENSIHPIDADAVNRCRCVHISDVSIRFPDGSHKRPDISIFCHEPHELFSEVTLLPEVVIEVLSEDYVAKDLLIGVPFYQQIGIKDIVVFDPQSGEVRHWQQGQPERVCSSPAELFFLCGCVATV